MAFDLTTANTELASLLADVSTPDTVTISGTAYTCARVTPRDSDLLAYGDMRDGDAVSVILAVQASAFATAPTRGTLVTYGTNTLRIVRIAADPVSGLELRLYLGPQHATARLP